MAENSKDELNNKREQSKVEKEINEILNAREQAYKNNVQSAGDTLDLTRQITEDIKDQLGMTRAKAEADTGALSLARKLQQSAQQVTSELGNQGKIQRQLVNDQNLLSSIRTEISIIDGKIGEEGASAASDIANALFEQQDLQKQIEESRQEMSYLDEESKKYHQEHLDMLLDQVTQLDNQIKKAEELSDSFDRGDIRRLVQLKQQETLGEKLISQRKDELETQRRIEDRTGVTGALVEGVGGIMQRLGMRSGIFQNAMEKAADEMQKMAEESERVDENGEAIGKQYSKTAIALKGITELTKGFGKALGDPLTITLAIADAFFKVDAAASKLQQTTGQNSTIAAGLNTSLASTVDVLEVMTELTAQTGMNAQNIFSPDVLAGAAELKNTLGLAADEAGGLAMIAQTTGGDIDATTDAIVDQTSAFNKANRSAVSQGQVLRDVAKTSDGIKASFAGMPGQLAKAASAARRMGMDLQRLDDIASSLLDFESSIEAELEAQLLTGRAINMSKARELAMNNKLAELGDELFKNSVSIHEFGKMNRIQQEAQAKALGLSRDELGKIAYNRALELNMTKDQAAAAAGVRKEDMERMAVQEKLAKAAEKMTQAFAPMLDILIPVADLIGFIAKIITWPVSKLMELADSVRSMNEDAPKLMGFLADGLKLLAGIGVLASLNAFKNFISGKGIKFDLFSKLKDKITGAKDKISDVTETAKDKLTKSSKGLSKGGGGASKGTSSLTNTIQKIDAKKLLAGAAAMAIAAGAVFIFAKAAQEFMKVTPGAVLGAVGAMFALVGAVALLSLFVSGPQALALLAGAAAMLIIAGAVFVLGKAIQEVGKGMEALGNGIDSDLITNLFAIGPALASAAKGLALFAGAMALGGIGALIGGGMIGQLETLAGLASPLSTVGTSLTAIAAGIVALSAALNTLEIEKLEELKGLVMTTAFAAPMVAATGAITSMLQGISGGGEGQSNKELLAEIKLLREAVQKGGNVYMDGDKVGSALTLGTFRAS